MIPDVTQQNSKPGRARRYSPEIRHLFVTDVRYEDIRGERELELIRRAKAGDQAAKHLLDQAHLPLVYKVVRRYFGLGVCDEDLIQEGRMGLQHAVQKFDESQEVRLGTYAVRWINHYAYTYTSRSCSDIRVPRDVRYRYRRATRKGNSVAVLAESADPLDRLVVENIAAVVPPLRLNVEFDRAHKGTDKGDWTDGTFGDRLPAETPLPDEELDAARTRATQVNVLSELVASLPAQERDVVLRRYPLDPAAEPETQVEIAGRFVRADGSRGTATRQRVNQIEQAALDRLRGALTRRGRDDLE